jgi:hypothetical protein
MFEIAGGIILAVAFFILLPILLPLTLSAIRWGFIAAIAAIIIYFIVTEFAASVAILGTIVVAVFFMTVVATLIGIGCSRFSIFNAKHQNNTPLIKLENETTTMLLERLYDFYGPIGLRVVSTAFIVSVVILVIFTVITAYG